MTRQGFENIINDIGRNRSYPLKHKLQYLLAHDQAQREEIARLREALERIKRITQVHSSYLALDVCTIAQAALAKEATRDHAE